MTTINRLVTQALVIHTPEQQERYTLLKYQGGPSDDIQITVSGGTKQTLKIELDEIGRDGKPVTCDFSVSYTQENWDDDTGTWKKEVTGWSDTNLPDAVLIDQSEEGL